MRRPCQACKREVRCNRLIDKARASDRQFSGGVGPDRSGTSWRRSKRSSVEKSCFLFRRRQAARVAFSKPAISVAGEDPVSRVPNPARDEPRQAQEPPDPAQAPVNLERGVGLVVDSRFIDIDHRPLAGVFRQRRKNLAGGLAAQRGKQNCCRRSIREHEIDEAVAHDAHVIVEDDGLRDSGRRQQVILQ